MSEQLPQGQPFHPGPTCTTPEGHYQTRVLSDVIDERHRQGTKWGVQNHGSAEWLIILGEEYGEACQQGCNIQFMVPPETLGPPPRAFTDRMTAYYASYRNELVQVAAVAIAAIECLDRNNKAKVKP